VLLQDEIDRGWLPLGFASRKLEGAEARCTVSEKECTAVIFGLRKFRYLLYGEDFVVVTDHNALRWLMSLADPKDRLARWMLEAQSFGFSVEYSPGDGEWLAVPDAMLRDTMDRNVVYCGQCLEALCATTDLDDICRPQLNAENVKQRYGDPHEFATKNDAFVVGGGMGCYTGYLKMRLCESSYRILL
jgi:RNase H-like domain found in reverse transcriptase